MSHRRSQAAFRLISSLAPAARGASALVLLCAPLACATGDDLTGGRSAGGTADSGGASTTGGASTGASATTASSGSSSGATTGGSSSSATGTTGGATGTAGGATGAAGGATGAASGATTASGGSSGTGGGMTAGATTGGASTGSGATTATGSTSATSTGTTTTGGGAGCGSSSDTPGKLFFDDFEDGEFMKRPRTWSPVNLSSSSGSPGTWAVIADPSVLAAGSLSPDAGAADAAPGAAAVDAAVPGAMVLAQTAAAGDWLVAVAGDYRCTDQVVSVKFKITTAGTSLGTVGVFARYVDTRNYYFLYIDSGSKVHLRGKVDGSSTDAASSVTLKPPLPSPITAGTWHTMKLSVVGQMLSGYVDDQLVIMGPAPSPGLASGGIAVGTDSDATAEFDDVSVTAP